MSSSAPDAIVLEFIGVCIAEQRQVRGGLGDKFFSRAPHESHQQKSFNRTKAGASQVRLGTLVLFIGQQNILGCSTRFRLS